MMDAYWGTYDACLDRISAGVTAQELVVICNEHFDKSAGDAFFPNGADRDLLGTLMESGWRTRWVQADYYFEAEDRDGNAITFVEGDIYLGGRGR
jgi:hypothetical protein